MRNTHFFIGLAFSSLCVAALGLAGAGCGDDGASTSSAATSTSASSAAGGGEGGGTTGAGGMTGAGGTTGSGGMTGSGGTGSGGSLADVNPIEGITKDSVQKVVGNFQFTEGPLWIAKDSALLFSDIPADTIYQLDPPAAITTFRNPSNMSNGLALDENGLLVAAEHAGRRVSRTLADSSVVPIIDQWQGKKLNSPNDVIVRSDGNVYFTDPPYGLPDPGQSELGFFGVFRVDKNGTASLIAQDMQRPNGIALSPDESLLYVADTETAEIRVYNVAADGTPSNGKKLLTSSANPDGMAIDDAGNLYLSTSIGVEVVRPDGTKWGTIEVAELPANCGFGGADRKTLYITARTSIYAVALKIPGIP